MEKAIDFLRRELSDLERLMNAIENAMERKQSSTETVGESTRREEASIFGHDRAISLWVD